MDPRNLFYIFISLTFFTKHMEHMAGKKEKWKESDKRKINSTAYNTLILRTLFKFNLIQFVICICNISKYLAERVINYRLLQQKINFTLGNSGTNSLKIRKNSIVWWLMIDLLLGVLHVFSWACYFNEFFGPFLG